MNCKRVDQLLPLYVGRDLEAEVSRSVAAHLQSCSECARVADEYAGANQLLRRNESPLFSDEVYAGIRRRVADEIERNSHTTLWTTGVSQFLALFVQPRFRWITAALLLTSITALYFVTRNSSQLLYDQQAEIPRTVNPNAKGSARSEDRPSLNADSSVSGNTSLTGIKVVKGGKSSSTVEKAAKTRATPNKQLVQSNVRMAPQLLAPARVRVEMQTRNPNIRIIWLPTEQLDSRTRETSKGI